METVDRTERLWYTIGEILWCSKEECQEQCKKFKHVWFQKGRKTSRAKDFDWEIALDGKKLTDPKYHPLSLMRRTWESLKARIPEKANEQRLKELREKTRKELGG